MRQIFILPTIFVCSILAGCSSKTAVPVDFSNACKIENEKKYVQISGYLDDKGGVFCSNTGGRMDCGFTLTEKPKDEKGIRVEIEQGNGANEIGKLERGYKLEDIKIFDNSGSAIKLSDKVKIAGEMNVMPDGSFCFIEADRIER